MELKNFGVGLYFNRQVKGRLSSKCKKRKGTWKQISLRDRREAKRRVEVWLMETKEKHSQLTIGQQHPRQLADSPPKKLGGEGKAEAGRSLGGREGALGWIWLCLCTEVGQGRSVQERGERMELGFGWSSWEGSSIQVWERTRPRSTLGSMARGREMGCLASCPLTSCRRLETDILLF